VPFYFINLLPTSLLYISILLGPSFGMTYSLHQCNTTTSESMSQSLKKTFITTVLTAVKKNKQPTHMPGGPGRLRSWSGPVDPEFQGRLRFT
jgi:hypothetical protein